jgi:signal transduction histidine kinase
LAAVHLLIIPVYYRGVGPFSRWGVRGAMVWLPQAILVNGLLAALSSPGTYGNALQGVPGAGYSGTVWLVLAFYPWLPSQLIRWRTLFELLLLGSYDVYFLFLAWLSNGSLSPLNVKSAGMSFIWLVVAYVLGKAVKKMCVAAAEKQLEVQQQNFDEFFDFLHSHVKASITAVRMDLSDPPVAMEKLGELEETIGSYRVELLLAREQVPLAAVFSERIRTFNSALEITETPRLGSLTVGRAIGVLVGRALGDLLKNAAKYGATKVQVRCDTSRGSIHLEIADNGPGFSADVLDDESRSLHRLRQTARNIGGDLTMRPQTTGTGAVLSLVAPLHLREVAR